MAVPIHLDMREDEHKVAAPDLGHLLALRTNGMASEGFLGWFGKDAPRDHFTAISASPKIPSLTDAHSLEQERGSNIKSSVGSMYLARERTDSEKAVKGSDDESATDGRVTFQKATVKEPAGHIPNDADDELNQRGKEVRTFWSYSSLKCSKI